MATWLVFAGRWTEKRYHCKFVCMRCIKLHSAMTFSKASLCGCTGKSIFSSFIPTMQFVEKQHNLT